MCVQVVVDETLRKDKKVILFPLKQHGNAIEDAGETLREDE